MSEAIWKFPIELVDEQTVEMPIGAEILCAQVQRGIICIWAKVKVENKKVGYTIRCFGTGHEHKVIQGRYVGSVQLQQGALVFHIFEGK